jgi:hypothetical protein
MLGAVPVSSRCHFSPGFPASRLAGVPPRAHSPINVVKLIRIPFGRSQLFTRQSSAFITALTLPSEFRNFDFIPNRCLENGVYPVHRLYGLIRMERNTLISSPDSFKYAKQDIWRLPPSSRFGGLRDERCQNCQLSFPLSALIKVMS